MQDYYLESVRQLFADGIKIVLIKCISTPGGHRRIHLSEIQRIIEGKKRRYSKKKRGVATYARVSSHDQKNKGDLDRQQEMNIKLFYTFEIVSNSF